MVIYPVVTGGFPQPLKDIRYAFAYKAAMAAKTDGEDPVKMAAEALTVSILDLVDAYDENAMKADKAYRGKTLRLTGKVSSIEDGFSSFADKEKVYYVRLHTDSDRQFLKSIHVYPKKEEAHKLEDLIAGQTVTIVGKCDGGGSFVEIKDAFFE